MVVGGWVGLSHSVATVEHDMASVAAGDAWRDAGSAGVKFELIEPA